MNDSLKLNNLSEIADKPQGVYSLPDGYNENVLRAVRHALNYCLMRRQIWLTDDGGIEIVPPNPKSEEARPDEFKMYRRQLYQYLLVLDCANEILTSGKKAVRVQPNREVATNFIAHANRIADVVHGIRVRFEEHPKGGFLMVNKGTEAPLTKRVFSAMKEANENGRSVMSGISEKIMSVKTYVSSYRHVFPDISMSMEGMDVIFEKSNDTGGDIDDFQKRLHQLLENAPAFTILPIDLSIVPVSPNYFRTKVKSIPCSGYDISVTIQSKEGRVLVYKVSDEWQCAMSAESDIIGPEWDDDEAYEDEPDNSDFEIENDEIL